MTGNPPAFREVFAPALSLGALEWAGCVELVVTRVEKEVDETSGEVAYSATTADIWLVEDGWVVASPEPPSPAQGAFIAFLSKGDAEVVVLGLPRWQLELALALPLLRANVLSRRQRLQVVRDLAPRMRARLAEHWKDEAGLERDARRCALALIEYLVEHFRRPLHVRALGGALAAGIAKSGKSDPAVGYLTRANLADIWRSGVEHAPDLDAISQEDALDIKRSCDRVLEALAGGRALDEKAISSEKALDLRSTKMALAALLELGDVESVGRGRFQLAPGRTPSR